jgi:hypothetical protein
MITPLYEAAKVTGGEIHQAHDNWCKPLDPQPGPCSCAVVDFKVVRNRPSKRGGHSR